MPIVRKIY